MMTGRNLIPILVVSGFLGSGKTTLIRRLLQDRRLGEAAVIVNEFGEVGIDHHLIRATDERTILIEGGCLCCSMRDDLAETLRDLLNKRDRHEIPQFERVIIETTGLADPVPIIHTIVGDPMLRNHYRIERLIVTIDAVTGQINVASSGEAIRQVAAADQIVVTKQDLVPEKSVSDLMSLLRRINPAAQVVDGSAERVDLDCIFDSAPRGAEVDVSGLIADTERQVAETVLPPSAHAPGGRIASRCLVFDQPLNWQMFGLWLTMLLHHHGSRVLRVKGLLNVGKDRGPMMLEGVQHVVHAPRHLRSWPDANRQSRIVFILRDIDPPRIEASLNTFQEVAAGL